MVDDSIPQHRQSASPYEQLPMAIRQYYDEREYLCLTDTQKAQLLRAETEPDPE